jgi:hypothetical protein
MFLGTYFTKGIERNTAFFDKKEKERCPSPL